MSAPLPPTAVDRIDEVCDRFEAAWKAGQQPRVEDYLDAEAGPEHDTLLRELQRVEAHYRQRAATAARRAPPHPHSLSPQGARGEVGGGPRPFIAGYELIGELGRGGMGVVYKARQLRPNRLVALKMISAGVHAGARELERFQREADAVAQLQDPHIVQVYEVGEQDGHPYFAMEYVAGGSLDCYLAGTPQPPRAAAQLVERLAHAIHHAHQRGIIHRDLKPANVLLQIDKETRRHGDAEIGSQERDEDAHGSISLSPCLHVSLSSAAPKITDFGLAKLLDAGAGSPTQSGEQVGTPSYMAPEQVWGSTAPISAATDVYGLGAILYELLTGRPPFRGETPLETMLQVQTIDPVSPSRMQPKCPRDLVTICLKCLSKQPGQRYATALELGQDLRRFLDGQPIRARPVGPLTQVLKWTRRQPVIASLAGLLLLAVILGVGTGSWFWWQAEEGLKKAADSLAKERTAQADRVATLGRYRVALAHREWLGNNVGRAQELLDLCTEDQRQAWEWRYLDRMRHSALHTFSHGNTVQAVAIHPEGRLVASASHDQLVRLWDLDTESETVLGRHPRSLVMAVAYSPDGRLLASSDMHFGRIKVWDLETREVRELTFEGKGEVEVRALAFDRGSRYLAAGGPGRLKVWDTHDQKLVYEVGDEGQIFQVAFSPDGRHIATSSRKVKVWDWAARAHKPVYDWPEQAIEARDLAFSPKENLLAFSARDGLVRVYSLETGQEAFTLDAHQLGVTSVSFSPDGERLASAGMEGDMHIWNVKQRRRLFTLHGHSGAVYDLAYTPNGSRLVSCGLDRKIRVWDAAQGQEVVSTRLRIPSGNSAGTLVYSRDSRLLAWVSSDRQAGVWDAVRQQEVYRLAAAGGRPALRALAGSPDGRYFAWGCTDGRVRLWDAEGRKEVPLPKGGTRLVLGVAFIADGRLLVARRGDKAVLLGDAHTGRELHALSPPSDQSYLAAFSPDGRNLTLASEGVVQEWDTDSGRLVRTLPPPPEAVVILAYSPAGDALAFGGTHGRVWIWDRVSNRERVVCAGHPRRVWGLAFSADGRRLASSGSDCTAKLWDTQTGDEVLALRTQLHERSPLAFSPDGADLVSVSVDNHLQIWSARSVPAPVKVLRPETKDFRP